MSLSLPVSDVDPDERARIHRLAAGLLKPGLTDDERHRILRMMYPDRAIAHPEPLKSAPLPAARKKKRYWIEADFRALLDRHRASPTHDTANEMCEKHFMPLATGWCASKAGIGNHEAIGIDDAVQTATIVCLSRVDHYDPARGTAFNFFSKVCQNAIRMENNRELTYKSRFINVSELQTDDSEDD